MEDIQIIFSEIKMKDLMENKNNLTKFIKNFSKKREMNNSEYKQVKKSYPYLDVLDLSHDEYIEFGADKCEINNLKEFCNEINVDFEENMVRCSEEKKQLQKYHNEKGNIYSLNYRYHFYSRDKKITFTCSSINQSYDEENDEHRDYLHYFGLTGEFEATLIAFKQFYKRANYAELSFGREYI
jgi:hypothetical protein